MAVCRHMFTVVKVCQSSALHGRPRKRQRCSRADVGQAPREETAEILRALRVSDGLWGFGV